MLRPGFEAGEAEEKEEVFDGGDEWEDCKRCC